MAAPVLQTRDLSLHIGGRVLFEGLCLEVGEGEVLVVQGPSGAGKSTLLRALAGLLPCEGEVLLDGRGLAAWGAPRWRAEVAWLPQGAPALGDAPAALAGEVRALASQVGRAWQDPGQVAAALGLDAETWQRPWRLLSGGERQRAHLALALASQPRVLLLDEPTSALDEAARALAEAALQGRTAVWVTHDAEQAARVGGTGVLRLGGAA